VSLSDRGAICCGDVGGAGLAVGESQARLITAAIPAERDCAATRYDPLRRGG
jgi:hypothetical protein